VADARDGEVKRKNHRLEGYKVSFNASTSSNVINLFVKLAV
jgi:hypothetical protein